jgi:hypothetical protein
MASTPVLFEDGDGGLYQDPLAVAIGDFNNDGKNDLAVLAAFPGSLEIRFGDGKGGFSSAATYAFPNLDPYSLGVGDVNGDGLTDLVVATFGITDTWVGSGFFILQTLSDGGRVLIGPFSSNPTAPVGMRGQLGPYPSGMVVADFNSDGISDVAIANPELGIDISYGLPDGGFNTITNVIASTEIFPVLAAGDLNGDGRTDLAFAESESSTSVMVPSTVGVLLQGDGGLAGPAISAQLSDMAFPVPAFVGPLLVAVSSDFNGAEYNRTDLLQLNGQGGLDVLYGRQTSSNSNGYAPIAVTSADLNGDGLPDLLVTYEPRLLVWLGHGASWDGGFGQPISFNLTATGGFGAAIAVGDLNGDGRPDIAVPGGMYAPAPETAILLNDCAP